MQLYRKMKVLSKTSLLVFLGILVMGCTRSAPVKVLFWGNWADPTVVKMGDDYYLTSNNDHHVPSVLVWHSKDLRNWQEEKGS